MSNIDALRFFPFANQVTTKPANIKIARIELKVAADLSDGLILSSELMAA